MLTLYYLWAKGNIEKYIFQDEILRLLFQYTQNDENSIQLLNLLDFRIITLQLLTNIKPKIYFANYKRERENVKRDFCQIFFLSPAE